MTEKIWLKSYDPGVPATIDPDKYPSINAYVDECINTFRHKDAFVNMGKAITYGELDQLSQTFAGFLQAISKLSHGDRVAIMMPNLLQYPVVMFGVHRAKMIVVNVNPLYTPAELHKVLVDSGAKCIVVLENFAHVVAQAMPGTAIEQVIVTQVGDLIGLKGYLINFVLKHIKKMIPAWHIRHAISFKETMDQSYRKKYVKMDVTGEDIAYLQYTGGTTGGIKGAILTHRNIMANVLQAYQWLGAVKPKDNDRIITALPLYHIFSLTINCLCFFFYGQPNILITNPKDIPGFVKTLKKGPFFILTGVNTLFNALLRNEDFKKLDFSHLQVTLGGGMAVQKAVADRWQEITHHPIVQAYGLTECSPGVAVNCLSIKEYTHSIGLPICSTDVKICDENDNELPVGQSGELVVKGPQVMRGYWNQPEETKKVLTDDGWLHTGDIAQMDEEGQLYIVDRKKDVIIVSGFNVYPNEIEDVIAEMKAVREVAVIGVPSQEHGETVKAVIVPEQTDLTAEEVIKYCRTKLTGYKIPKSIEFRKELPKTNVGKVLRKQLREEALKKA